MIISCPACEIQFNVDPALLGPDGRKVRCAKCAHVWRVGRDGMSIPTGPFGLQAPTPAATGDAAPEIGAEARADTDVRAAPDTPEKTEASGAAESGPATEKPSLWARELIEREVAAKQAAGTAETAASTGEGAQQGAAAGTTKSGLSTATDAKAGGAAGQAKRRKGGKKFKVFLLLLFLVVIALIAAAVLTGRFGPGGIVPASQTPTTGDVAPPASDIGFRGSKAGSMPRDDAVTGGVR